MRLLSRSLALAATMALAILPSVSQSQVVPAIRGGGSQINVYGLYSLVNPSGKSTLNYPPGTTFPNSVKNLYGQWHQGGSVGADFRLGRWGFGQPALGARLTFMNSNAFGKEQTYLFGPELHYVFGRFHPYGNFLLGKGDLTYSSGQKDDSIVYDLGGGVDYRLNRRFSVRMFDFQYQFWNLSVHQYPAGLLPGQPATAFTTTLRPYSLNFGIVFRVR